MVIDEVAAAAPGWLPRDRHAVTFYERGDTLADAVFARYGIEVAPTKPWLESTRWRYQAKAPVRCSCHSWLRAFRRPYRSGIRIQRHWALVCPSCATVLTRDELQSEARSVLDDWDKARTVNLLAKKPHYVYVVRLEGDGGPGVYVGESAKTPEQRFAQHKAGQRRSRVVEREGVELVPFLYDHLNPMVKEIAQLQEALLADDLEALGLRVEGGH